MPWTPLPLVGVGLTGFCSSLPVLATTVSFSAEVCPLAVFVSAPEQEYKC